MSTVQVREVTRVFWAISVALTRKVCEPSAKTGGGERRAAARKAAAVELATDAGAGVVGGEAERGVRIGRDRASAGPAEIVTAGRWCRR